MVGRARPLHPVQDDPRGARQAGRVLTTLSVVVATKARADRLRTLLDALEGLDVVVVADGATPEVLSVAARAPQVLRLDPGRGPAAARNAGWRAATGDMIAFTDDDCVPAPGWPEALLAASDGASVVQGPVEPLPAERDRVGPFARTLWVREGDGFFQTANVAYPRALLERLGGFDEAFTHPAGEDTDLGLRAVAAGARVVWAPGALVWHAVHEPGWRGLVRDAPRWGSAVRLVARHPALRARFHHRWFWKRSHEALLLALAGGLAARRTRGLSLAAALPWLLVHRTEHPDRGSLLRALPAHLAVDAAETAAMARGSIRARTLLL